MPYRTDMQSELAKYRELAAELRDESFRMRTDLARVQKQRDWCKANVKLLQTLLDEERSRVRSLITFSKIAVCVAAVITFVAVNITDYLFSTP